jgi:ceramide glucosyltransferase
MADTLSFLADLGIAGAVIGCAFMLFASAVILRHRSVRPAAPAAYPPVSILKPLDGAEPELFERLASLCTQDYPAPIEIICGVHAGSDPAIEVVQRLKARFPDVPITIHVDAREHGFNRKVSNLINMLPLARFETLIMSDSDVEVGPCYLAETVATLAQPNVGAATFLYHGVAGASLPSRIAALAINTQFLPQVVAALRLRLAQPCLGPTIAIRRQTLDRIGGLQAFTDVLAEDHAIGKAVREAGLDVAFGPGSIGHVCFDSGTSAMLGRQLRVARTIKVVDPIGYAGTALAHPFALALVGALLGAGGGGTVAVMAGALACRMVLCLAVQRAFRLPPQPFWLVPLHDLVAFAVYLASFAGNRVIWRRYKYRVASDGTLVEQPSRAG